MEAVIKITKVLYGHNLFAGFFSFLGEIYNIYGASAVWLK